MLLWVASAPPSFILLAVTVIYMVLRWECKLFVRGKVSKLKKDAKDKPALNIDFLSDTIRSKSFGGIEKRSLGCPAQF